MDDIWLVIGLALLPGLGNLAGGMVAEFSRSTPRLLNLALHAASGIVIGGKNLTVAVRSGGTTVEASEVFFDLDSADLLR